VNYHVRVTSSRDRDILISSNKMQLHFQCEKSCETNPKLVNPPTAANKVWCQQNRSQKPYLGFTVKRVHVYRCMYFASSAPIRVLLQPAELACFSTPWNSNIQLVIYSCSNLRCSLVPWSSASALAPYLRNNILGLDPRSLQHASLEIKC
jgi:hypothetical protein